MGLIDLFRKKKEPDKTVERRIIWEEMSYEEFEQAKIYYSNCLVEAYECIACERLIQDDPSLEAFLCKSGMMSHVEDSPYPESAVVFPCKDSDGRILYEYSWERIDSMSVEEIGLELYNVISQDLADGVIG